MSIVETVKEAVRPTSKAPVAVPPDIADKIRRGRLAMLKDHAIRRCCQKFWEGEHYWYVNSKNGLSVLPSALVAVEAGKPLHRIRNTYNFAASIIEGKVSASTQKVPGYETTPSTGDAMDIAAAKLSSQFAIYGFDKWRLRRHTTKAFTNAFVQREGFVMPYWDPNVGPFRWDEATKKYKGRGELKVLNLNRSEVMWEPGVDFDDSRWHAIERAQTPEDVKAIPGYVGGALTADARTSDIPEGKRSDEMIRVTEFLERPCPKYPEGRKCYIANERVIVDYRKADELAEDWYEPYPCLDANGEVSDEPVLHRISYTVNPEGDDLGLMERLIDLTRTIDDCWNKILEWKNRCLVPQWMAPNGSKTEPKNDIPGYTYHFNVIAGQVPQPVPVPPIPRELIDILQMAIEHMRALAADIDVQPDPRLTTGTANAAVEQSQNRWQSFLGDAAEFHSRFMRHCLSIVAQEYDTQRQIDIRGQYGWEPLEDFTGQDLRSQVNVRVLPGTIEAKSRQQIMTELQFITTAFPGALSVETTLAVLHGGDSGGLIKSYENHVARANEIVRLLRKAAPEVLGREMRQDLEIGDPAMNYMVPRWMPRKQDNLVIHKQVVGDYMVTPDFDQLPIESQGMFSEYWDALEFVEQQRAMKLAMREQNAAAEQGAANAARPQDPVPVPVKQDMTAEQAAPEAPQ